MPKSRFIQAARFAFFVCIGIGCLAARSHSVECDVSAQVRGEMGGGANGTIVDVGTKSPHIGWYRIVF